MAMRQFLIVAATLVAHAAAHAQATPVGLWKTIDDESRAEKSLIRISEQGGVLNGRIEKLLDASVAPNAACDKCSDERKGLPLIGLQVLRHAKQSTDDPQLWEGGDIVDPNNGKVYKARLKPVDGGKKLEMRGYLGPFYRTQTWLRVE